MKAAAPQLDPTPAPTSASPRARRRATSACTSCRARRTKVWLLKVEANTANGVSVSFSQAKRYATIVNVMAWSVLYYKMIDVKRKLHKYSQQDEVNSAYLQSHIVKILRQLTERAPRGSRNTDSKTRPSRSRFIKRQRFTCSYRPRYT